MARKYYSNFEGYNTKMFRDTETNEIFIQQKIAKPPPKTPTPYTTDYFDIVVTPWIYVVNNRISPHCFCRTDEGSFILKNKMELFSDYYSFQFDELGIENYKFDICGDVTKLRFFNDSDKAKFIFYYSDIIEDLIALK